MEPAEPTTVVHVHVSAAVARAIYLRGLGLGPEQWTEFSVATEHGEPITLFLGNSNDGVVEVICPHPALREQLAALVGFRMVSGCSTLMNEPAP